MMYQFQIILVLNLGARIDEIKFYPFIGTQDDLEAKIESYKAYDELDYLDAQCIDDYGNIYIMLINKNLLQNSYFRFVNLGKTQEEI